MSDNRLFSAAAARNRKPILDVLSAVLPKQGLVLEVASGSGEHVVHFAARLTNLTFAPSDPSPEARASVAVWIASSGVKNVRAPLALDAASAPWPIERADAVICINMVHISPWAATEGLFDNAGAILPVGAPLYLYGPYKRGGAHTASSNAEFDAGLCAQNPSWGVRDLETVADLGRQAGFERPEIVEMPANNLSLIFRRSAASGQPTRALNTCLTS
ncbi:class I SAM-dependent methyltransferase (plasmid) [Methylocystis sp. MJC1]|jgi:hypothetical protein|uniref:DUF938 domain-containing protein n=1 Tax=Methylocystis sp. MJC1 TaxID=2654282 RepID=UPI0013EAE852|nr:DUF938 domain-containing protein [Methylocystis sp. MJC1]KAF2991537.1 hypothetical protein MJC1_01525 [Methylocystis sp. MJC1]MBU6529151.1 DUF938 domain-containing protein [Methylocystis sp. MJC1]UZX13835.1 class I SAM-dependent methyltransferase [Methylocystis sp. MJC1]